jgi:endonuclease/exonuclease/phosphatase family metal-dependent hydrolase
MTRIHHPPHAFGLHETAEGVPVLRVATYNIHKGVRGFGAHKRLEIHNLVLGIEALDADLVFLQEVRHFHHGDARRFQRTHGGWPSAGQAEFLAPEGYHAAYRTNATTREGEHGNALLSRWPLGEIGHHDISDHRFEQRGLLYVPITWGGTTIHTIVAHLGLMHGSRVRQVQRIAHTVMRLIPPDEPVVLAGDFNDWNEKLDAPMTEMGLTRASCTGARVPRTFPSRFPLFSLDRFYTRGFRCIRSLVPQGSVWARMSDHLPFVVELVLNDGLLTQTKSGQQKL